MAFQGSATLAAMYRPASRTAVESETSKLLAILGETDGSLAAELANTTILTNALAEMVLWNTRLADHPERDRLGHAATRFFAAQALTATVMLPAALDSSVRYSPGIARAMVFAADGLFDVGRSQFDVLGRAAQELLSWISSREFDSVGIIESPLGNSLPVQVVCDLAKRRGINCVPVQWNPPRNDRRTRGRTVTEAARECADATANHKLVVLMDDALTGTRFVKLFDALADPVGRDRFLPIVMRFKEMFPVAGKTNPHWERLFNRVTEQGKRIGYPTPVIQFPTQRIFRLHAGESSCWHSPIMWGDSDLIAGKRKVNLTFTLISHCFTILEDLATEQSRFSVYLERAWHQDTTGAQFSFAPGIIRSTFSEINSALPLDAFISALWDQAKTRFPEDYRGAPFSLHAEGTEERWKWFREAFLAEVQMRLDEQRALITWMAFDNTFAASFSDHKPKPDRDTDASACIFPYNSAIAALNLRLRERICELVI